MFDMLFMLISIVLGLIALALVGFVALMLLMHYLTKDNPAKLESLNSLALERYGAGDYYISLLGPTLIGISWDREIFLYGGDVENATALPFSIIKDATLRIDDVNVTTTTGTMTTRRGSQIAGAAIGGALLGPAGVIVGGTTAGSNINTKAIETQRVKSVKLIVRVDSRDAPLREVTFYADRTGKGADSNNYSVATGLERARHYHALLTQLIDDQKAGERGSGFGSGTRQ